MPWQTNKTFIIIFSYLKMPRYAPFCEDLSGFSAFVIFVDSATLSAVYWHIVA